MRRPPSRACRPPPSTDVERGGGAGGFALEDAEWWALLRQADARGERVQWIIHSHVDLPPALSAEDRAAMRLLPGVDWLVVSLRSGQVDGCALHLGAGDSRVSKGLGPM